MTTQSTVQKKIVDILGYEATKYGAQITLKFNCGFSTKRKCINTVLDHDKTCALSKKTILKGQVAYYVAIKRTGFTRYYLSQEAVNQALNGEYREDPDTSEQIVKDLLKFLEKCQSERSAMLKEDKDLRDALKAIKYKNSKLGVVMSATNKLLELVS